MKITLVFFLMVSTSRILLAADSKDVVHKTDSLNNSSKYSNRNNSGLNRNIAPGPNRSCDKTCLGTKYCQTNPNFLIKCSLDEGDF